MRWRSDGYARGVGDALERITVLILRHDRRVIGGSARRDPQTVDSDPTPGLGEMDAQQRPQPGRLRVDRQCRHVSDSVQRGPNRIPSWFSRITLTASRIGHRTLAVETELWQNT